MIENQRLNELRLGDGRDYLDDGFILEKRRALAHCINVAGKSKFLEPVKERPRKKLQRAKIVDLLRFKTQMLDFIEKVSQAASDQKIAPHWQIAHEEAERRLLEEETDLVVRVVAFDGSF